MNRKLFYFILFVLMGSVAYAQVDPQIQAYRNEPHGDKTFRKKGIMDGNLVRTVFRNDGQTGIWTANGYPGPSGEWPKGTAHNYIDGCTPLVVSKVVAGNGQTIHPVETSYREEVDRDPVTGALWVTEPVPGYAANGSEEPAINTKPFTWPTEWPKSLSNIDATWDGYWYGYFGRGVQNADFETFFVMDDSQDKEFARQPYNYFPIASDSGRAGLGLRMEIRGFQWSHVLAEDIIFWHFDIVNLSDGDLDSTMFGFYCDTGVGGYDDGGDDNASFDTKLDLAYAYDNDGVAPPNNWKTGYIGYAFLESPGNGFNNIDDDEDGLLDERRDDNIDNDGDWIAYTDLNENGKWDSDINEPLNNDVGTDGVGPFDPQYNGPDADGTEGNGLPNHGEPNFDETDKDESDQIGLTSLAIERLANKGASAIWPKNDEVIWQKMNRNNYDTTIQNTNIQILFGSGPFPLKLNKRERFSVALVYGSDYEDMIFNKETVQQIYNANYNFSKPPYKATLHAVAGDKKVFLYWNSVSEESRDAFLGFENNDPTQGYKKDFEGYLIYRSEEPEFNDIKIITDSKGEPKYWKPIAQFDLKDGIKGSDPVGINGAHFWRGSDNGLQHSYVDSSLVNGQTYYYACVAYDMGDPAFGTAGLLPSETTKIIQSDVVGTVKFIDINCAVVTPNAPAAGYLPPEINGKFSEPEQGLGTGNINVRLLDGSQIEDGATYYIKFNSSGDSIQYRTTSYNIIRQLGSSTDTIAAKVDSSSFGADKFSPPFDGLAVAVNNFDTASVNQEKTGWIKGFSTYLMPVTADRSSPVNDIAWPANYQIEFLPDTSETSFNKIPINIKVTNITGGYKVPVVLYDNNRNKKFDSGDELVIVEMKGSAAKSTWRIGYTIDPNAPFVAPPVAGDIFQITTNKPFLQGDYFTFTTQSSQVDNSLAKSDLDKIDVVPNPYISTDKWEKRNLLQTGRGERRIDFTNLPFNCTVRIYTITGALIKTLYKDSSPTNGSMSWNLITEDGMDIAYGLYIYHVDAPGVGEKIGKFAIIK